MKIYTVNATCELAALVAGLASGDPLSEKIIFCEDKFTLESEIALSKRYGGTFGTRVFSFNRYMHKYLPDSGEILSPESAALVVKRLILENRTELTCFKNVYDPNLASVVYELIAQLKSAKIAPADVYRAAQGSTGILRRKLDDIYLIFSSYEKFIAENGLTDGNNRLNRLPGFFAEDPEIKRTDVIIAGFPSLNRTLCEIFKSLYKNAKSITFALVAGENSGVYTNETFDFAMREFNAEHIRAEGNDTRIQLLDRLFCPKKKNANGNFCPDVHVYRAQNINDEIEYVARLIASGVRHSDGDCFRYKDYAVCAENIDSYYLTVKRVFADYGIPCFIDVAADLSKHPLTRLTEAFFDVVRRGYAASDYLRFVKNPLITADKGLSDGYENYVLTHAINRKGFFDAFSASDDRLEEYEELRTFVAGLFLSCANKLSARGVTSFSAAAEAVEKLIGLTGARVSCDDLGQSLTDAGNPELAAYNAQAYEKFIEVISSAKRIIGDKELPLSEIKNIIVSGMTACKISVIQELSDCVFVGDFRSVKYKEYPTLFVVGLGEGVPATKFDSALLCDRDIAGMEEFDVSVEPKIKEVNRRNRENACMAVAAFGKRLYLSWAARNADGEECRKSEIIDYVISAFSDERLSGGKIRIADKRSNEKSAEAVGGKRGKRYKALPYMTERSAAFGFAREVSAYKEGERKEFEAASAFYSVMKKNGLRALPDGLLGAVNSEIGYYTDGVNYAERDITATALEGFFRCPYKNFLSNGVKLYSREEGELRGNITGNLIHEIAQNFVRLMNIDGDSVQARSLAEKLFEDTVNREEYSRYFTSAAGKRVSFYLKKEVVKFCLTVFDGCNHSMFRPKYIEVSFGYGRTRPAIIVNTRGGVRKIIGKADRIDVYDKKMSIIDYKTGKVGDENDKELYTGKKLQLFLYAKAFSDEYQPVGAYYFPVEDVYKEDEEPLMAMEGKTLADLKTASEIDDSVTDENRIGRFVSVNLSEYKNGKYKKSGDLLTRDEFDGYLDYAVKIAAEGLSEINEGVIIPSPDESACEYCEYHGLCGYDVALDGRTRTITETIKKEKILAALAFSDNENETGTDDNEED